MNSIGITITVLSSIFLLLLPRRLAFIPIMVAACYLTAGQEILVLAFHFTSLRIIVLTGCVRIILRKEITYIKFNKIDKTILLWVLSNLLMFTLLYQTTEAFINRLGVAYNTVGLYFIFRALVRDLDDFKNLLTKFSFIIVPLAVFMIIEHKTGRNAFAILGGVDEISSFRDGKFRSQGPFGHSILAGTMGATMLPMMVALWWQERSKHIALLGIAVSLTVMITSSSSGPFMAAIFGILGLAAWRFRGSIKIIRRGSLFILLLLHFVIMKAPVWYLFDRITILTGGSGWYRAELIEQAVNHFGDWWLMGTKNTGDWFAFSLQNKFSGVKADITNQFIGEGVNGGLLTMILFIVVIVYCFKTIGDIINNNKNSPFRENIMVWSMGAALFAHVMSFFSVAYFDQIVVFWYLLLAMISSLNLTYSNKAGNVGILLAEMQCYERTIIFR